MSSVTTTKNWLDFTGKDDHPEHDASINIDEKYAILNIIEKKGSHLSIAKLVEVLVRGTLVVTNPKASSPTFYMYFRHRWHAQQQDALIVQMLRSHVIVILRKYRSQLPLSQEKIDKKDPREVLWRVCLNLENHGFASQVVYEIFCLLYDDTGTFIRSLDTNTNLLGFENGVFDLEKGVFRDGMVSDMISKTTGMDFPTDVPRNRYDEMLSFVRQILAVEDVREYVLQQFAQNLNGRTGKHLFHFLTAFGSNGKTSLLRLVSEAFGQYAFALGGEVLTKSRPSSFGGNPLLIKLRGVRLVYIEDSSSNGASRLNAAWVKELTGCSKISARLLHSNEYVEFKPQ